MPKGVEVNVKRLITLIGYLNGDIPKVKVGIIGSKAAIKRQKAGGNTKLTNAQIGFIHEFGRLQGKPKIPARSFIYMPLSLFLGKKLEDKQSTSKEEFEKAIKTGKAENFAKKVGIVAEEVIQEAFETSGFGNWEPNRPSTIKRKGSDKPLIDTGELRRSISSEVIK